MVCRLRLFALALAGLAGPAATQEIPAVNDPALCADMPTNDAANDPRCAGDPAPSAAQRDAEAAGALAEAAASEALTGTAHLAPFFDRTVGDWKVDGKGDRCSAAFIYEDESFFLIFWNPTLREVDLTFANENWQSLRPRDGDRVRVYLNLRGDLEYDEFWDDTAIVAASDSGPGALVVAGPWQGEMSSDLLAALAFAGGYQLTIDGRHLGGYTLRGSKRAIEALLECGNQARRRDTDPFD